MAVDSRFEFFAVFHQVNLGIELQPTSPIPIRAMKLATNIFFRMASVPSSICQSHPMPSVDTCKLQPSIRSSTSFCNAHDRTLPRKKIFPNRFTLFLRQSRPGEISKNGSSRGWAANAAPPRGADYKGPPAAVNVSAVGIPAVDQEAWQGPVVDVATPLRQQLSTGAAAR